MKKDRRAWWILFCLALVVRLLAAWPLPGPPYVDAYFYTVGAYQLAEGHGFQEMFLWHYLDDPTAIPRPGFLYWMPLPSVLGAISLALLSSIPVRSFLVVQLPFVLFSALLVPISYSIARRVSGLRRHAWAAALLALFSGFFFPFWTLPETFAPFSLVGCLALWLAGSSAEKDSGRDRRKLTIGLLCGVLAGLAHLTRADGVLLLPVVGAVPWMARLLRGRKETPQTLHHRPAFAISYGLAVILGYGLMMIPWFMRNLSVIGALLSPAGTKTLWLRTYDDIACYGCDLSLRSYLAWGGRNILNSKLSALWINFQRFLGENCQVFLFPFVLIGFYRLRRRVSLVVAGVYLVLLYLAHSLAFTFPGWRGGFFHSSGAVLPFLYVAAMEGLDSAVGWAVRKRRGWNLRQARGVFTGALVVAAVVLSAYAVTQTMLTWQSADTAYREIGAWLDARDVPPATVVMVNNPPGFYYHTSRPAVVVPNGGPQMLSAVADRYQVAYVVLDRNRAEGLAELYADGMGADLELVASFNDEKVKLFRWVGVGIP